MTGYTKLNSDKLAIDKVIYQIRSGAIMNWIHEQPSNLWELVGFSNLDSGGISYLFSSEMEVWFKLRWQ